MKVKRTIAVALAVGMLAGAFSAAPAEAGKKKKKRVERTVEARYENPAIGSSDIGGLCVGCASFATGPKDLYAMVEITDDASPTAGISFSWDTDGDGISDTGFEVCGKTEEPVPLPGSVTINAFAWVLPGTACPNGISTSGSIKVTFSNLP